jgi:23S rRNA (adenine2503-C2)-methyltransferase
MFFQRFFRVGENFTIGCWQPILSNMSSSQAAYPFARLPRSPQERLLDGRQNLKDLLPTELEAWLAEISEPRYRAKQILRWVYQRGVSDFDAMTDLSKALREKLKELAVIPTLSLRRASESRSGDTQKFLFELPNGGEVESVQMRYGEDTDQNRPSAPDKPMLQGREATRVSVCISSQVGCAMGCNFCASGVMGLKRHLATWEIVDQVLQIQNAIRDSGERVANVVFMGLGEPLHNFDEVMRAVHLLNFSEGMGIGMRHLTISTSGLVPQIHQLAETRLPIRLAISLHAVRDELRSQMMPVNQRYNIATLLEACGHYYQKTGRRVTFEYILLDGVNDSAAEANELAALLSRHQIGALVNLIPWNPVDGVAYKRSKPQAIRRFQSIVEKAGIRCTVRQEKGADIDAACGQLRLRDLKEREQDLRDRRQPHSPEA